MTTNANDIKLGIVIGCVIISVITTFCVVVRWNQEKFLNECVSSCDDTHAMPTHDACVWECTYKRR